MIRLFRMLSIAAAGVWLGAMILIAIVAATTFGEMRTIEGIERPNYVAGRVMAKNFARYDRIQLFCAGVIVLSHVGLAAARGMRGGDWLRAPLLAAALLVTLYGAFRLTPTIQNMQDAVAGAADPEAEVKRVFDGFHRTAVTLSKLNMALVAILLFSLAWSRDTGSRLEPGSHDPSRST